MRSGGKGAGFAPFYSGGGAGSERSDAKKYKFDVQIFFFQIVRIRIFF